MIKQLIDALNVYVNSTEYFGTAYSLAEQVERDEKKFPAIYIGSDNLVQADKIETGVSYFRITAPTTFSKSDGISPDNYMVEKIYNLRWIGITKREKTQDTAYGPVELGELVSDNFNAFNFKNLAKLLSFASIELLVERVNDNRQEVILEEYSTEDCKKLLDFNQSAILIDFTLTVRGLRNCLATPKTPEFTDDEDPGYLLQDNSGKILQGNGGGIVLS